MTTTKEVRFIPAAEVRLDATEGQNPKVVGYASVFNSLSEDLGGFREMIMPGAFTKVLASNPDVRFLLNHEDLPLARTISGTLKLEQDDRGLKFEAELDPNDPDVQRLMPKMKRGDLSNCSFAFLVLTDSFETKDGQDIRKVLDVECLYDVSVVTYPAYPDAKASLRSYTEWKTRQSPSTPSFEVLKLKLDLMMM